MAKKIITLYIDDTSVRVLALHGRRIKKWAELPLEPGLVQNGVVLKEAEVAARVRQLMRSLRLKARKIIVGISGLHCLSRPITLPHLPGDMLDEAVKRETKSALPVPLEQLYLSWQTLPAPPGKTRVFLVAIPRPTADALLKTLARAGLKPYLMDLKPLALARAAREVNAIIVDVQPTEFDLVIVGDGVPQPIRTVPLPAEALSWPEKLPIIKNDLARTIEFYNANNPEKPLPTTTPLLVSGELASEPELLEALADGLGYPVSPMPVPLECVRADFNPERYTANMGLALKEIPADKETSPLATNLNALPAPYRAKPISLTNILAPPAAAVAIGIIAFLLMLIQGAATDAAATRSQMNTANQRLQQKMAQGQELAGKITELENKIAEADASGNNFIAAHGHLKRRSNEAKSIEITLNRLPGTLSLGILSYADRILTANGRSPDEDEVLAYLKDLVNSGQFSEVVLTSLRKAGDEGVDFTLLLRIEAGE